MGWALPAGLATGLAAWVVAGGSGANLQQIEGVETLLAALKPPTVLHASTEASISTLVASPLFALTTGPGAVREPSIRLDGVSVSRRRIAALVSVDGKPAGWMLAGDTQDGVTLQSVTGSNATFETAVGSKTLNLGEQSASSAPVPSQTPQVSPSPAEQAARSVRPFPEPAGAPRVKK